MNILKEDRNSLRETSYYRRRYKNRFFSALVLFFAEEAERTGMTKTILAKRMGKDPAQVTRLLSEPANLTLDTVSDYLLAMEAEAEPPVIVRFADRRPSNSAHELYARLTGVEGLPQKPLESRMTVKIDRNDQVKEFYATGST